MKKRKKNKVTINDVAREAGVSKSTVSRFINEKYDSMSVATKERLEEIIAQLNFRPNKNAQRLKAKHAKIIGCVIADIRGNFSTDLLNGINDVCARRGYQVLFAETNNNEINERMSIEALVDNNLDGILVNTTGGNDDYLIELDNSGVPIVIADRYLKDNDALDVVTSTNYQSTYDCVSFLHEQGYDDIYFISQEIGDNIVREVRFAGYLDALAKHYHVDGSELIYYVSGFTEEDDTNYIEAFINEIMLDNKRNICLFAVNGNVLLRTIKGIKQTKYKIGQDIGVCGFDEWEWASMIEPGITTIQQDTNKTGRVAANLLIDRIEKKVPSAKQLIEHQTKLIARGSTTVCK